MAAISLSKLNKHYGSLFHAVKDVDLEIACVDGHQTAQEWTVTDASALALTLGI